MEWVNDHRLLYFRLVAREGSVAARERRASACTQSTDSEYLADQTAADLTGEPDGLANALEKLQFGAERLPSHAEPATASLFIVSPLAGRSSLLNPSRRSRNPTGGWQSAVSCQDIAPCAADS